MTSDHSGRKRVLVVYGTDSAASPSQLKHAAAGRFEIGYAPTGPVEPALRQVLARFGPVFELDDTPAVRAWRPDGVVAFSESALLASARLAAELGLPGVDEAVLRRVVVKPEQRAVLREAGVDTTRSVRIAGPEHLLPAIGHVGLPAVVKPASGTGGRHTYRIDDIGQARSWRPDATLDGWVVEELLHGVPGDFGDYVSVETVAYGGVVTPVAIFGKHPLVPPFRETGGMYPSTLRPEEAGAVTSLATRAVTALGLHVGMAHVEVKLTPEGPRIIEVNARLGGYTEGLLAKLGGPSLLSMALDCAVGERPRLDVTVPADAGVSWFYLVLAPVGATKVRAIDGIQQVRAMPDVTSALLGARAGDRLDWRAGSADHLVHVQGVSANHADLLANRRAIDAALRVELEFGSSA